MENDFNCVQKRAWNKLWQRFPVWVQRLIIRVVIIGSICSTIWGAIKFIPDSTEWVKAKVAKQNETHFVAQQVWTETQSNLKTLSRFLEEKEKFTFRKKSVHFIYDTYGKYNGQLGEQTSRQIDHFYKNLKRIENGEPYTRDEILKIKSQGTDVLNFLKRDFGLRDYFENNQGARIASAFGTSVLRPSRTSDNIVSADNTAVVSADLPILTSPPYEAVGEITSEGDHEKSH